MPYIHWDTDRKREKMARLIHEQTERHRDDKLKVAKAAKDKRKSERESLVPIERTVIHDQEEPSPAARKIRELREKSTGSGNGYVNSLELRDLVAGVVSSQARENKGKPKKTGCSQASPDDGEKHEETVNTFDKNGRMTVNNPLGQLLIDAARLYEAMSVFRDEQLFERYLHHDPPLHTRRTLDQSYYWILKSTRARDRDQVVYRETHMNPNFSHKFREVKEAQAEISKLRFWRKEKCKPRWKWQWKDHWRETDKRGCDHCRSEIRKVPRIIMVDQLWMWILDESTIITCFPKRYGVNKQDLSGVHRSIRMRLKAVRKNQIRSVFDLALIILDECSNTFFDRTKTQVSLP